jgi:chromosomal replication initiation ATPase DnaA
MAQKARQQGGWRDQVEAICQQHEVALDEVLGRRRTRRIVAARHNVMVALRARGWSTTRIGQILCRDHSTVVHALKKDKLNAGGA